MLSAALAGCLAFALGGSPYKASAAAAGPPVGLTADACPASDWCVAVGSFGGSPKYTPFALLGLIETFSSGNWTAAEAPLPGGGAIPTAELYSVACPYIGSCVAVGDFVDSAGQDTGLIETLAGGTWTAAEVPLLPGTTSGALISVACPTSATCAAVGNDFDPSGFEEGVIDTLIGGKWTATVAPIPAGGTGTALRAVTCPVSGMCVAVGTAGDNNDNTSDGLIETLSGGGWTPTAAPVPSGGTGKGAGAELEAVHCAASGACVAAGDWQYRKRGLIETLSGGSWTATDAPVPPDAATINSAFFHAVECPSAGSCVAVGTYTASANGGVGAGLIETLSGGNWTPTEAPLPSGQCTACDQPPVLNAVSCQAAGVCTAVGDYTDTSGNFQGLIENLSGGQWMPLEAPVPPGGSSLNLGAITCLASGTCVAVGNYSDSSRTGQGLIETLAGGNWTPTEVPRLGAPPAVGSVFKTVSPPFRICDTRTGSGITPNPCNGNGATQNPLGPGGRAAVQITGNPTGDPSGGVPTGATAVVINLTGVSPSQQTLLAVAPSGSFTLGPSPSDLNLDRGAIQANLVTVQLSSNGAIDLYNAQGTTDFAIDVMGYFTQSPSSPPSSGTAGTFHPLTPSRVCDTRVGSGIAHNPCNNNGATAMPLGPGGTMLVNVGSTGAVPGGGAVSAVVFNLTAVLPSTGTYLTAYPPTGGACPTPTTSNLNVNGGAILPNRVMVTVGSAGSDQTGVCIYNAKGTANIIVDVNGWFGAGGEATEGALFYAVNPERICDTRPASSAMPSNQCSGKTLAAGATLAVNGVGTAAGDPTSPIAVVVNTTGINITSGSTGTFLSLWPDGSRPGTMTSDLNPAAGEIIPNMVVLGLNTTNQEFDLYNDRGSIDVAVDAEGWFQ